MKNKKKLLKNNYHYKNALAIVYFEKHGKEGYLKWVRDVIREMYK